MAFCSFDKETTLNTHTEVENVFLHEYMPVLSGEQVKTYLYGLYLCQNAAKEFSLSDMAKALKKDEGEILDHFRVLEETGLVEIIAESPCEIKYVSAKSVANRGAYRPGKYTAFTTSLQKMFPTRMISPTEFRAYFSLMEEKNLKPDALLMLIRYCVDKKGQNITYRYITAVANDFAGRGILTSDAVESELSDYFGKTDEIDAVLKKLGVKRKSEAADLKLYEKWTSILCFPPEQILYAAGKLKKADVSAFDSFMKELYAAKAFGKKEIDAVLKSHEETAALAREICRNLGIYVEVIDPVVANYVAPWLSMGYEGKAISFLSRYVFKKGKRSLQALDETVRSLYEKGVVATGAIIARMEENAAAEKAITDIFKILGIERRVTGQDRAQFGVWKEQWGFSDEMVAYAAQQAAGKNGPIPYMNAVLSALKNENVYTVEEAEKRKPVLPLSATKTAQPSFGQRTYSETDLERLLLSDGELL